MKTLTTRSIQTAEAIRDRVDFKTHGSLKGETLIPGRQWVYSGYLNSVESEALRQDSPRIDYVVWSYSTPIAWHTTDGHWHRVDQKFSVTTTKHQGNLYLI